MILFLIFEDGSQEILSNPTNETSLFKNGKKIGSLSNEQLALQKEDSKEYPTSQTLKIPYGKQFKLILSDGFSGIFKCRNYTYLSNNI